MQFAHLLYVHVKTHHFALCLREKIHRTFDLFPSSFCENNVALKQASDVLFDRSIRDRSGVKFVTQRSGQRTRPARKFDEIERPRTFNFAVYRVLRLCFFAFCRTSI